MNTSLHYLLMANHLLFQKALLVGMKDTELTSGQPKVLDYLLYHDGAVQKEIAEACHIEPATMTSVLLGMEQKGLIVRKNQNGNRRSLYVYLTDKGKTMADQVFLNFERIEECAFQGMNEAEQEQLLKLLFLVNQNMRSKGVVMDAQSRNC